MYNVRKVTDDLYWVGANDHRLSLFENIHPLYHGVSYNSYLLLDEKTVLFDTADWAVGRQFIENVKAVLDGRPLDYLVINHVEPDHASSIEEILLRWPQVKIITTPKAVILLRQFGYPLEADQVEEVREGDSRCFGKHTVVFAMAPMVHWPEAMVSFDTTNGVLFSADAFGSFRALDGKLFADEFDFDREWLDDARRYYTNIVGKYGPQVQALLKKASNLDIQYICPLHGPVWRKDLGYIIDKYVHWSTYEPEEKGVMIVYASMYGNTETAAEVLASKLADRGVTNTRLYDVSSTHVSYLISDLFKYSHLVLASVTYNLGIFPPMHNFLADMKALNLQKRTCAILENGSWAPRSGGLMRECLEGMKNMTILDEGLTLSSALHGQNLPDLDAIADAIAASVNG
ncbi:FprA family A-type flavoprotein [Oscillibacter valericigenes]|uniref:FprA family A-type flavoprotein n=1 Tax=Oscillibacter valericigenes TaxID=351091 RepID=UPI001F424ED4|nr:FprA family A-type flavoprotein [Oscillibacter valericigenes]MCF2664299.1 FprA family A-type flavoprotein [Oscillibacter valericigenes]